MIPSSRAYACGLFLAVALALTVATILNVGTDIDRLYASDDPGFFRLVASDPFGGGDVFRDAGRAEESSYRYGRIGLPLAGWVACAGVDACVPWSMAIINLLAIAAIPAIAALFIATSCQRDVRLGALLVLCPSLLVMSTRVYADPLMVALLTVACLLAASGRIPSAALALAAAILCRESAALVVIPLAFMSARRREWRTLAIWLASFAPYAVWSGWVLARTGELPFLSSTPNRRGAVGLPFVALVRLQGDAAAMDPTTVTVLVLATVLVALGGAWLARRSTVAIFAGTFGVLTVLLGPFAVRYLGEAMRLTLPAQVFGLICVISTATRPRATPASAR